MSKNIKLIPFVPFKKQGTTIKPTITGDKLDISAGLTAEYNTQVEQLTDPNFNNWGVTGLIPSDWDIMNMGGTSASRSTDKHSGDYAVSLTSDAEFGESYVSEFFAGGGAGSLETLQLKVWAKGLTGVPNLFYIYSCEIGEDEYYYNFTGGEGVEGTWTIPAGEGPDDTQIGVIPITSEYTELVGEEVTLPDGASNGITMFGVSSALTGAVAVLDDVEILVEAVDVAVNGGFENWTTIEGLTDWDTGQFSDDGGTETTFTKESTIKRAGSYSVKSVGNNGNYSYLAQLIEGGTADETLYASYYARGVAGNAGTPKTRMCFLNHDLDNATQVWKTDTEEWEAYINIAGLDNDNFIDLSINTSETFTESTEELTMPVSEKVYMIVYTEIPTDDDVVYVDSLSLTKSDLGYGNIITVDVNGNVDVDGELVVDDATSDDAVPTLRQVKETGAVVLGSGLVDMTAVATTEIYVETTNSIPLFVVQVCEEISDYSEAPVWSIGTNDSDYDNLISGGTEPTPVVVGGVQTKYLVTTATLKEDNIAYKNVKVNVTTGSDATSHKVRYYLFGIKL